MLLSCSTIHLSYIASFVYRKMADTSKYLHFIPHLQIIIQFKDLFTNERDFAAIQTKLSDQILESCRGSLLLRGLFQLITLG